MFSYYIIITVCYLVNIILFYKGYKELEDNFFELLDENCNLKLEKIDLLTERNVLVEELNKYKE